MCKSHWLFRKSMALLDSWWDRDAHLVVPPGGGNSGTRETLHYALGLLMRGSKGDAQRASTALNRVLDLQWEQAGSPHHGTFARSPSEFTSPEPREPWKSYDPNMREFMGTVLCLMLHTFRPILSPSLRERTMHSVRIAAEAALARAVSPSYTNIALMDMCLLDRAGALHDVPQWRSHAASLGRTLHDSFRATGALAEYNSPTYYGVDLCALAQCRAYATTGELRTVGREMERKLWHDIAQLYHAGLRNLCGPWVRSYGMDMTAYCSVLGLWIASHTDKPHAPLPNLSRPFVHHHDISFAPLVMLLQTSLPPRLHQALSSFGSPHAVAQRVPRSPETEASAWLGHGVMLGGLRSDGTQTASPAHTQCHPATIHWLLPGGAVGWVRLVSEGTVDAAVSRGALTATCRFTSPPAAVGFDIHAPGAAPKAVEHSRWRLPGLSVAVSTDASRMAVESRDRVLQVRYAYDRDRPSCTVELSVETAAASQTAS
jgi:hypothetical protein